MANWSRNFLVLVFLLQALIGTLAEEGDDIFIFHNNQQPIELAVNHTYIAAPFINLFIYYVIIYMITHSLFYGLFC